MTKIQNNLNNTNKIIESINPKNITKSDLEKIVEIEQDMWWREDWIGEYLKCEACDKIYSKEDIFGHLSKEIKIKTIKKIEEIINPDLICFDCNCKLESIYDRSEYIKDVYDRYQFRDSVISVIRDNAWEIIWFFDWYKSNLWDIFFNEFIKYYGDIWIDNILNILKNDFWINIYKKIFVSSALWMEDEHKNFINLYNLMKHFYENVFEKHWLIDWIYESKLWTNTHAIYELTGATRIWITNNHNNLSKLKNINESFTSDIFFHKNVALSSISKMSISAKEFIKLNSNNIKKITTEYRNKLGHAI